MFHPISYCGVQIFGHLVCVMSCINFAVWIFRHLAFISTTLYPACWAMTWARVVLPRPGGPHSSATWQIKKKLKKTTDYRQMYHKEKCVVKHVIIVLDSPHLNITTNLAHRATSCINFLELKILYHSSKRR